MSEIHNVKSDNSKVILISGHAGSGKDTVGSMLANELQNMGLTVLVTHYADLLKFMCKSYFGWDGNKDEFGRSILQHVGTDVVRKKNPDYWVDYMAGMLNLFRGEWDYVIIPDTRFPNEVTGLSERGFDTFHARVERPSFENSLTSDQQSHVSETALDNVEADFYIDNTGSLEDLRDTVRFLARNLLTSEITDDREEEPEK